MRVLVLHSELGVLRGGGENFTRNLFTAFADRGHQVTAAFVADRSGQYPIPLPRAIESISIRGRWSRKFGQETLLSIGSCIPSESRFKAAWDRLQEAISWRTIRWHNRRFQRRVVRRFARHWIDFDVVYVHGDPILASVVARWRPTLVRLPGPVTEELAPVLRAVHGVCANGDALRCIRAFLGDQAIELPIGLDDRAFKPGPTSVRSTLGWTDQHRVFGYVGRLTYVKGVDLLAAAFREVSKVVPDARLLIVGSGEEEGQVRSILAKEFAGGMVHLQPDVKHNDLPDWYRAMDILVMPSRYENFSNALLEAMACGIPFLASDVGGNRMLSDIGAGWLFQPESPTALAAQLEHVITDRAEMKGRGCKAAQFVRGRYSWSASANCLEEIIRSRALVQK